MPIDLSLLEPAPVQPREAHFDRDVSNVVHFETFTGRAVAVTQPPTGVLTTLVRGV
jgi:hypothetical protein